MATFQYGRPEGSEKGHCIYLIFNRLIVALVELIGVVVWRWSSWVRGNGWIIGRPGCFVDNPFFGSLASFGEEFSTYIGFCHKAKTKTKTQSKLSKPNSSINRMDLDGGQPFPFGASVCKALTSSAHLSGDSIPLLWSYVMPWVWTSCTTPRGSITNFNGIFESYRCVEYDFSSLNWFDDFW